MHHAGNQRLLPISRSGSRFAAELGDGEVDAAALGRAEVEKVVAPQIHGRSLAPTRTALRLPWFPRNKRAHC